MASLTNMTRDAHKKIRILRYDISIRTHTTTTVVLFFLPKIWLFFLFQCCTAFSVDIVDVDTAADEAVRSTQLSGPNPTLDERRLGGGCESGLRVQTHIISTRSHSLTIPPHEDVSDSATSQKRTETSRIYFKIVPGISSYALGTATTRAKNNTLFMLISTSTRCILRLAAAMLIGCIATYTGQ